MEISKPIDLARRWHWLWGVVPTWLKLAILSGISTALGVFDGLPIQAIFVLLLGTVAFGMIIVRMTSDAIERSMEPEQKRKELLEWLGRLRLTYINLEREFLDQNGDERLWHKQTGVHNTARHVIETRLGVDYYSEFKNVKAEPVLMPASFPKGDFNRLNLLYMIHGRSEWLGATIKLVRDSTQRQR